MESSVISSRATGAFIAMLVILVLAFVASVHSASNLAHLDQAVTRARDVLEEVTVTRATLHEVESTRLGYVRTRQKAILELYLEATKDTIAHLDHLRDLTRADPPQRRRVDAVRPLVAEQLTLLTNVAASPSASPPPAEASPADEGEVLAEQIRGLMVELQDDARARLQARDAEASARSVKVIRGFGAVALIALLLLGGAYYLLDRDAAVHDAVLKELRSYARPPSAADPTPLEVPAVSREAGGASTA